MGGLRNCESTEGASPNCLLTCLITASGMLPVSESKTRSTRAHCRTSARYSRWESTRIVRRKYRSSGVRVKRQRTSSSLISRKIRCAHLTCLPLPSFAPLIVLQILLDGGLIDFGVEQRALNVAMPQLLAHGRDWNPCLQKLTGSSVAQLVNRRLYPGSFAVLLPGIMDHAILQWERTATIAGITAKDGARGDTTLLEMSSQQANTFRGCSEHHRSLSLTFAKDADFLIISAQINLRCEQTERLPHPNPRFIEERKEGTITQVGSRNGLKNLRHRFRLERAWLALDLLRGIETLHGVDLHDLMTNEPAVKGTERTVASAARGRAEMAIPGEKGLNGLWCHGRQIRRDHLHKQAQIMRVRLDHVDGNGALTKACDKDLDGISSGNLRLVGHGRFPLFFASTI